MRKARKLTLFQQNPRRSSLDYILQAMLHCNIYLTHFMVTNNSDNILLPFFSHHLLVAVLNPLLKAAFQ